MSTDPANVWAPTASKGRLSDEWSAYLVEEPLDMPSHAPELMRSRSILDGEAFGISGSIQKVPAELIVQGDPMQMLVAPL